jgi:streptogramin lyase
VIRRTRALGFLAGLLATLAVAAPAAAAPAVSGEFDVPGLGSGNKLVQGPDGNIWVTLDGNNRDVARITPAGAVTEFDLEAVTPKGIAAGPEGRLWIARNGGVVSFDPANPTATKKITDIALIGTEPSIALGPDGNLWATGEDKLVRIPPANPIAATAVPVPGLGATKDIDAAGSLIVAAAFKRIVAVTTAGAVVGDQAIGGQAQGVAGNPNGQYAFTQPVSPPKEIGLLSPTAAPVVRSAEGTDPFGIALGSDGAYWSPEFIADGLTRIAADGTVTGLTGFAKASGPRQIAAGPGNTLWVTLEMTKKVGRVSGLEPPVAPQPQPQPTPTTPKAPEARIEAGPKGKVTTPRKRRQVSFRFSSPDAGASFECRLQRLPRKPVAKATAAMDFKACASPRTYRLRPGRYRFDVRAVLAGVADQTPEGRSFRIVRAPLN